MHFESNLAKIRVKNVYNYLKNDVYRITFNLNSLFSYILLHVTYNKCLKLPILLLLKQDLAFCKKVNKTNAPGLIILAVLTNFLIISNFFSHFLDVYLTLFSIFANLTIYSDFLKR